MEGDVDNGTKWRAVPADFPPGDRVYTFSAAGATTAWSRSSPNAATGATLAAG